MEEFIKLGGRCHLTFFFLIQSIIIRILGICYLNTDGIHSDTCFFLERETLT